MIDRDRLTEEYRREDAASELAEGLGYGPRLSDRLRDTHAGETVGYAQQTVTATVAGLASIPDFARAAEIGVETAAVRFADDGSVPTATLGDRADAGARITVTGRKSLLQLRVRREGATSAVLNITYTD